MSEDAQDRCSDGSSSSIGRHAWKIGDHVTTKASGAAIDDTLIQESFGHGWTQAVVEGIIIEVVRTSRFRVKWHNLKGQPIQEYDESDPVFMGNFESVGRKRAREDISPVTNEDRIPLIPASRDLSDNPKSSSRENSSDGSLTKSRRTRSQRSSEPIQDWTMIGLLLDTNQKVTSIAKGSLFEGMLQIDDIITKVIDRCTGNSFVFEKGVPWDHLVFLRLCEDALEIVVEFSRPRGDDYEDKIVLVRKPIDRKALSRTDVRKQIHDGCERRGNDQFLLGIFVKFSVWSLENERKLRITQDVFESALKELGIDSKLVTGDYFDTSCDHDPGSFFPLQFDEFHHFVRATSKLLADAKIRTAFSTFGRNEFVHEQALLNSLKELSLPDRHLESIVAYFKLGSFDDHLISFDEYSQAILSTVQLPDEEDIRKVFEKHAAPGPYRYIPKDKFREALESAGIVATDQQMTHFMRLINLNHEDTISFSAFKEISTLQTPAEAWAATLPLSSILADALPKHSKCDHLRIISSLTPKEIEMIVQEFSMALKDVLSHHVSTLKGTIVSMDNQALKPDAHLTDKFEVSSMQGGQLKDFGAGFEGRLGTFHNDFLEIMKDEHCKAKGRDFQFSAKGDINHETSPSIEWDIVMKFKDCLDRGGRKIPDIDALVQMPISRDANLKKAEIVAIVLFTGPMHVVYNAILRKYPAEIFEKFREFDNLFAGTISVLQSAIQKLSKVLKVPKGLILYRILDGTSDLPDSFYKADEHGCSGFVEPAFMSTTARKAVAINYSSIKAQKSLPLVLAIQVGAADRGACIRDFSQYPGEMEYLYAPGSFLEQSGPEYLEVTAAGVVKLIPVKASVSPKIETIEELEVKKKKLHLETFKFYIRETEEKLKEVAALGNADERLAHEPQSSFSISVQSFIERIISQCQEVYSRHESVSTAEYNKDTSTLYYGMVLEMLDARDMAICKLREWLENKQSSFLRFRFNSPLRTVHRRWIAYLERERANRPEDSSLTCELLRARRLILDSVHEKNELGETRLMTAAAEGRSQFILEQLIEASADVNEVRPDGVSPIWLAAQFGHSRAIQTLVNFKADVDHSAADGASPIQIAAQGGNIDCIRLLARLNADVNKVDKRGISPVHQAAMNGYVETVECLRELGANVNCLTLSGCTPLDLSIQYIQPCIERLRALGLRSSDSSPSAKVNKKLIISTGDISDIDGFLALAEYFKTGADVMFIMNYPGYTGNQEVDDAFAERNPGLGYKYTAKEVLEASKKDAPQSYLDFISRYSGCSDNEKMKRALTDIGFHLAKRVWEDCVHSKGNFYFCIGGINSVNPFSKSAMKNEAVVYSHLLLQDGVDYQLDPKQRNLYDSSGAACTLDWESYSDIYIDFNGSLAFWDPLWEKDLDSVASILRGVFVMGGVYSGEVPSTMPSIPNVLNRFSSATMNQLYHPENTAKFFSFARQHQLKVFVVTNNVVHNISTTATVDGKPVPTFEGVDKFLTSNGLGGNFLRQLAELYYNSRYNPPRKPFDFYTALALHTWMESGHVHEDLTSSIKSMFYSNVYGMTYVSAKSSWEEARAEYMQVTDTSPKEDDPPIVQSKKRFFVKEQQVLKQISYLSQPLQVHDLHFRMDVTTFKLSIVSAGSMCP